MKNKKGFTLIELICALVVISVALLFGMQLFAVGAKGYSRSAVLDDDTQKIVRYFETKDASGLPPEAEVTHQDAQVSVEFQGKKATFNQKNEQETVKIQNKKTRTSLSVYKSSIG